MTSLTLESGSLGGAATIQVAASLRWSGGVMDGSGVTEVGVGGSLMIDPCSAQIVGRTLRNLGAGVVAGPDGVNSGQVVFGQGARLENGGSLEFRDDRLAFLSGAVPSTAVIVNTGTVSKAAGSGESRVRVPFENDGLVSAAAGTLGFEWAAVLTPRRGALVDPCSARGAVAGER